MTTAFLSLGSNEGDRLQHLRFAVDRLDAADVKMRRLSPVYRTEAHTMDPEESQPDYFNAVVEVETDRSPADLLALAKRIEREAGRDLSSRRWAPRPIDIDLLVVGRAVVRESALTLPHPRIGERRFVLQPWADVAPNLVVPAPFESTISALLDRCTDRARLDRILDALL
ncbi:2-amino-4-hydroxy-6-hydroxymethyldihydropteridine diphosphokinase [Longibacter sp.]|uniref:2-amino-4-hydroxy-6- hydroxymethyldihydropteridine diphosphokinase n=1 Tax=Longibacter sp. TaxID=2045415 RepID=UPI003EB6FAE9